MGRQDDTGRRLHDWILARFLKVLSLPFHCLLVVRKWGLFKIHTHCAPAGACGRSAKAGSSQPRKGNIFAFPLAAPHSWNKIFCCECTSRLVDILCLGHAPSWLFLLSEWATQFEDKQRIQFLGTKVTCQQYVCYRLYIWIIPYHAVHKQWNRHRQQHPQLLYHVCVQQSARSSCQDWKTTIAAEKLCSAGHTLSLSCGEVSCFIASNKQCSLYRGCYLPLSTGSQTGELQHTSPAG